MTAVFSNSCFMLNYYVISNSFIIYLWRSMIMDVKFPIGQLELPEQITLAHVTEWLEEIETYTTRLREKVDSLNEDELNKTYREGSWNVRQLVHHIADSQLNMYQRLKIALTDDGQTVPNFKQ